MSTLRERLVSVIRSYKNSDRAFDFDASDMADYIIEHIDELCMYKISKHQVGDKVRIRKHMYTEVKYGGFTLSEEMRGYCGMEAVITKADIDEGIASYNIDIDGGNWYWNDSMLEDTQ